MTRARFRALALQLPEAIEASHMNHPDFRVRGKIFATLDYPEEGYAVVKLNLKQRAALLTSNPQCVSAVPGGWGRTGATLVHLKEADEPTVRQALRDAWRNIAPKKLAEQRT